MTIKNSISILSVILCIMCFIIHGHSLPSRTPPTLIYLKTEENNSENIPRGGIKFRGVSESETTSSKRKYDNTNADHRLQSSIPSIQTTLKNEKKKNGKVMKDWTKFRQLYSYDIENESTSGETLNNNEVSGHSLPSGVPSIHTPLKTEVNKTVIVSHIEITIREVHFGPHNHTSGEESVEEPNSSVDCSSEESSSSEECTSSSTTTTTTTTTTALPADESVVEEDEMTLSLGLGVCALVIIVAFLGTLFFFRKRPRVGIKANSSSSNISQV